MEEEFVYWRHKTPVGIKIEEVSGGCRYKGKSWREMARQIYCENGKESYREIGHFADGAPFLYGEESRISITHCDGLYVAATLPPTPEVELGEFSRRACMGIDAERADREQVIRLRERFLSERELSMISKDDIKANITAWTIKEAAYKAALKPGLDIRTDIRIERMPSADSLGLAAVMRDKNDPESEAEPLSIYSYDSEGCVVTLAFSPKCAKFGKPGS